MWVVVTYRTDCAKWRQSRKITEKNDEEDRPNKQTNINFLNFGINKLPPHTQSDTHPVWHTLYHTPCITHPVPHTLYDTLWTTHPVSHPVPHSVSHALYHTPCTTHPVWHTLYHTHCITPFTTHPVPYTLYHTPCTTHPVPHTLYHTPCTTHLVSHPVPHTLYHTPCTTHHRNLISQCSHPFTPDGRNEYSKIYTPSLHPSMLWTETNLPFTTLNTPPPNRTSLNSHQHFPNNFRNTT
jgi:hypothetical protein